MKHSLQRKVGLGALAAGIAFLMSLFVIPALAASADGHTPNQATYWQDKGEHPSICFKHEGGWYNGPHGVGNGKSFLLAPHDQNTMDGDHWELIVINAGGVDIVTYHPASGVAYAAYDNKDISHIIICKGDGSQVVATTLAVTTIAGATVTTSVEPAPSTPALVQPGSIDTTIVGPQIALTSEVQAGTIVAQTLAQQLPETDGGMEPEHRNLGLWIAAICSVGGFVMVIMRRPKGSRWA